MSTRLKKIFIFIITISLIAPFNFASRPVYAQTPTNELVSEINDLDKQIEAKRAEIKALQEKSKTYQQNIEATRRKTITLNNELAILSNKIAKINIDIETTEKTIEAIGLEVQNLELQIREKEENIAQNKVRLAEILRVVYRNDQKNYLAVLAAYNSFSEFFDQTQYVKELQANLQTVLNQVQNLKTEMETKRGEQEAKKQEEEKNKEELLKLQIALEEQMGAKELLLDQTYASEKRFQNFLLQAKYEEEQVNNEISSLERAIRQKLAESDKSFAEGQTGDVILSWPVSPARGITAYFHDPDYPFRYIFEHPAIDIRVAQGTPIAAPAPGYVARVQSRGVGGYSYIMLIHNGGISTVYGHVSKINVQEDTYVIRGQIIGLTGGMPGTPGAGNLTTGPHLHFEVRADGIPVNPLDFLP